MTSFKDKSNSEILLEIKQLQIDHEVIKNILLKNYDILEVIEKKFNEANKELTNRLTGE
jgi:hypothetical protein